MSSGKHGCERTFLYRYLVCPSSKNMARKHVVHIEKTCLGNNVSSLSIFQKQVWEIMSPLKFFLYIAEGVRTIVKK